MLDVATRTHRITNVAAATIYSRGLYTALGLENPKNSEVALIVTVITEAVGESTWYRYLLYKPCSLEEIGATGTWYNIDLYNLHADIWKWKAIDQLSDSLVAELGLTCKLQAFLSDHDMIIN